VQKNIVIGDDSPILRKSLRQFLEKEDSWVVVGEGVNGKDTIEKTHQLKPDLVVIDLAMPVMNGLDATRELRRRWPTLPLVMFTNMADPHLAEEAYSAGADAVVSKCEPKILVNRIYDLLGSAP
jgi:DNA-binding NarL/FixJ family response regulator